MLESKEDFEDDLRELDKVEFKRKVPRRKPPIQKPKSNEKDLETKVLDLEAKVRRLDRLVEGLSRKFQHHLSESSWQRQ